MTITNIAIIGAGQLGSRHLQGLKKAQLPMNIFVLDASEESLTICEQRYNETALCYHSQIGGKSSLSSAYS